MVLLDELEALFTVADAVAVDGINPLAEVRTVPDKFWNWGVPAPGRVDPAIGRRNIDLCFVFSFFATYLYYLKRNIILIKFQKCFYPSFKGLIFKERTYTSKSYLDSKFVRK